MRSYIRVCMFHYLVLDSLNDRHWRNKRPKQNKNILKQPQTQTQSQTQTQFNVKLAMNNKSKHIFLNSYNSAK